MANINELSSAFESSLKQGEILTEVVNNHRNYKLRGEQILSPVDPKCMFNQPDIPYDAVYPYNNSQRTPSGHVFELDDTPGSERINITHRTGTFSEIHPDGSKTEKIINDNFQVIVADNKIYVMGNHQETIQGDVKVYIQGNAKVQVDGDVEWRVGGNMMMKVDGIFTAQASSFNFIGPVNQIGDLSTTGNIVTQSNIVANKTVKANIDLIAGRNINLGANQSAGNGTMSAPGNMTIQATKIDLNP